METETKTHLGAGATVGHASGVVWLEEQMQEGHGGAFALSKRELETLVQWAYDQFGFLAEPSLEREAERAPDLIGMVRGHVDAAHEQQRANGLPADYLDALAREPRALA